MSRKIVSGNSLLEFSKAITLLVNTQETFKKSVESLQDFVTSVTADLDTEIRNKHLEAESLKLELANSKKVFKYKWNRNWQKIKKGLL